MLTAVVRERLEELSSLCERFGVRRLELFGSATSPSFDPERSDLDFLVEFEDRDHGWFDAYFGLQESLEELFGRPVDLVMERAVRNPYFLQAIESSRTLVYAA